MRGRLNAMTYRDTILQPIVVPFMRNNGLTLLQQDNARPHTARITTDFLRQQAVNVMPWPSVSPDLNPIEHLWDELGQRVRARLLQPQNFQQLDFFFFFFILNLFFFFFFRLLIYSVLPCNN